MAVRVTSPLVTTRVWTPDVATNHEVRDCARDQHVVAVQRLMRPIDQGAVREMRASNLDAGPHVRFVMEGVDAFVPLHPEQATHQEFGAGAASARGSRTGSGAPGIRALSGPAAVTLTRASA